MAVWSEVRLSRLYGANRLDAECYRPEVLRDESLLSHVPTAELGTLAVITDGQHGYHEIDESSEIRHITARCVHDGIVTDAAAERLSQNTHDANKRSQLAVDDVLLTTAGRLGVSGIVPADILPANIDQDVARIVKRTGAGLDPWFLSVFLNSKFGRYQSSRATTGQVQQHISLSALRTFAIPVVDWQEEVADLARQSAQCLMDARELSDQASMVLMKEINFSPQPQAMSFSRMFSETVAPARLDAEYFSPSIQQLISDLSKSNQHVSDVAVAAKRRFSIGAESFAYIEIGGIDAGLVTNAPEVSVEEAPSRAQWVVKTGDVITSSVRPIRRLTALITSVEDGYVCSSGFVVLRCTSIEPEVLLTYLRLTPICQLLNLQTTASMYPAVSGGDVLALPLPEFSERARKTVSEQVTRTANLRRAARTLYADAISVLEARVEQPRASAHA